MIRKLSLALCLAAAAFVGHSQAFAGTANTPFQALAHIDPNCTITVAGDLDFGAYDPLQANASADKTGSTSLTLTCTRGSGSSINLSSSASFGSGVAGKRAMSNGAGSFLSYDLFWPSAVGAAATATTNPWGDGTLAGTAFVVGAAPSIASRTVTVFGSIPAGQDASTGTYADSVVATVNF
jgi:spore coat protein U-like protein